MQGAQNFSNTFKPIGSLISSFTDNIVVMLGTLFGAAAVTAFLYGIALYIFNQASNSEKAKTGKDFMLWSVTALFVMVSVWGIIKMGQSLLGIKTSENNVALPTMCVKGLNCESDKK